MKLWLIGALSVALVATTIATPADAKRLGAGRPAGMQRNMPARTAPDAPPPKPTTPTQTAPNNAQPATPPAAPAAAPKRSWMGPLAGLAAGLGIAALLGHFGLGGAAANALMMVLLVGGAMLLLMFLLRRFGPGAAAARGPALATAGTPPWAGRDAGTGSPPAWRQAEPPFATADAARREASAPAFEPAALPAAAGASVAATPPVTRAFVPAAFDSEGFTRTAKMIFIRLQAANDASDLDDLRRFTTPELYASLRLDIQERGSQPQHTDVRRVEAEVLDVADEDDRQIASVRFHGEVVEDKGGTPTAFNEVWHLVRPRDGSREWAIAGIEPLN